jgi:hypothetical protein
MFYEANSIVALLFHLSLFFQMNTFELNDARNQLLA